MGANSPHVYTGAHLPKRGSKARTHSNIGSFLACLLAKGHHWKRPKKLTTQQAQIDWRCGIQFWVADAYEWADGRPIFVTSTSHLKKLAAKVQGPPCTIASLDGSGEQGGNRIQRSIGGKSGCHSDLTKKTCFIGRSYIRSQL